MSKFCLLADFKMLLVLMRHCTSALRGLAAKIWDKTVSMVR